MQSQWPAAPAWDSCGAASMLRGVTGVTTGPQGESGSSAAEGATAPETLRQKDQWADGFWKETLWASADGITISGKQTEGAHSTDRLESAPVPYILVSSLPTFIWGRP